MPPTKSPRHCLCLKSVPTSTLFIRKRFYINKKSPPPRRCVQSGFFRFTWLREKIISVIFRDFPWFSVVFRGFPDWLDTAYLNTHLLLFQKYDDIFDQKRVLIILNTPKIPFHFKMGIRVNFFWDSLKSSTESLHFDRI